MHFLKRFKKPKDFKVAKMKEILFKNSTSSDRKRKVFSSCVVNRAKSSITTTQRKYVYLIKKLVQDYKKNLPTHIFIRHERDANKHLQKFNCLLKGSFYACGSTCLYLIRYAHSLEIVHKNL